MPLPESQEQKTPRDESSGVLHNNSSPVSNISLPHAIPESEAMSKEEFIAKAFHDIYEALAPEFSYSTRKASAVPWADVPENNRKLMIATVTELLNHGTITEGANYAHQNREEAYNG